MKHGSKTVHMDERPSFAGSLVTIFAEQGARAAEGKTARDTLPGKSRVGRILLNDNNSQNRLLDMKLADIHQMRRKAETFLSHQQKTFIAKMEKRQDTWVREHARFSGSTNLVMPLGERRSPTPPLPPPSAREANKTPRAGLGSRAGEELCNGPDPTFAYIHGAASESTSGVPILPAITYLTEDNAENGGDKFCDGGLLAKDPNEYSRPPPPRTMLIGLPPITHARKTGFQPSGNINELFDDKILKRSSAPVWPSQNDSDDPTHTDVLPSIDEANLNPSPAGRGSKLDRMDYGDMDDEGAKTPDFLLSRSLPRIEMHMPKTRKHRSNHHHNKSMKLCRKRLRSDSRGLGSDPENPLGDERFTKLRELLASEIVVDHETREMNALAEGILASKRFGRSWKKS